MEASGHFDPFADLRALVEDLHALFVDDRPGSDRRAEAAVLFERLGEWIETAEQRKRQSDSVIDAALDAVIAIDPRGRIVEWNREAERIFHWTREEVLGRRLSETIIPARYRAAHEKGLERFLRIGSGPMLNRRNELIALRRDRTEFPVELTILEPIRVGNQAVIHAFLRDISERRRAEQTIRGSEALYHSLVDSLPIHVIRKNLEGRLTFANRTYCELLGRPLEELLGKTDFDLFPVELARKYVRDDEHVVATKEVFHDIEQNVSGNRTRYFEVYKVPVIGDDGQVLETQAIFWDVTERVETREALARERDLLRTLMDHLPDLVYVKDRDSRYVTSNVTQMEYLGLNDLSQIVGRSAHDFFSRERADRYLAEDREALETGRPILDREEHVVDPEAGREAWFSTSKVPLVDREGKATGIVGIDRVITKRKLVEQELLRSNRELDEFVSVVSHDVQAPLRVVATYCKLLKDRAESALDPESREYLDEALSGVARMQRLIDSLRSYARATEHKKPHEETSLDVALDQALANLDLEIRESKAEITRDPLPTLPGDPVQLMQLFQNLVSNAIKYCRGRTPRIHIGAKREGAHHHVRVSDNGIGIPASQLREIFRIFQRVHGDESEFGGSGVGLAVCKRIVERHGGQLWCESVEGQGSTFHFTLAAGAEAA